MKIIIATGIFPPDIGGPATYSKLLLNELPKRGIGVSVLSFGEVRHLPKVVRHVAFFFKLLKKMKGHDAIFAQDTVSVGLPSLIAARVLQKKFYIRVPGDYAWEQSAQRFGVVDSIDDFQNRRYGFRVELLRLIQKFVVDHSDMAFTPSIYFKNLVGRWRRDPDKVRHIYNGISLDGTHDSRASAREKLDIKANSVVIVSAGRLVPWKGFPVLVDVVGKVQETYPEIELYILGEGPERASIEERAKKAGLPEAVRLPGQVPRETLFMYLVAADVFVLNTHFESFSFQLVEAMNCCVPVISTSVGNIPEIITNGKEGILVRPDDRDGIIEGIRRFIGDAEFKDAVVKAAFEKSKMFSIDNTVNQVAAFLKEERVGH